MAEGYLRLYTQGKAEVYSAGIETHGVNPKAITVMKEDNIDISGHTSNNIDEYKTIDFDFIITVCDHAKENCPYLPSRAKRFHQDFPDPSKAKGSDAKIMQTFRETRDLVKDYCKRFSSEYLMLPSS